MDNNEKLEQQVQALRKVVAAMLYEAASRHVVPYHVNDQLVKQLDEAFPELAGEREGEHDAGK